MELINKSKSMYFETPQTNPCGLNEKLFVTVKDADPTQKYIAKVIRKSDQKIIAQKAFEGLAEFRIDLGGCVAPSIKIMPSENNVDTERAFEVEVEINQVKSQPILVCATAKQPKLGDMITCRAGSRMFVSKRMYSNYQATRLKVKGRCGLKSRSSPKKSNCSLSLWMSIRVVGSRWECFQLR